MHSSSEYGQTQSNDPHAGGHEVISEQDGVVKKVKDLLWEYQFATAARMARKGRYSEAETIIQALRKEYPEHPMLMDLLARIYAQQGRFYDAEAMWKQTLRMEPENERIQRALYRLTQLQKRPLWWRPLLYFLGGLVIIALFVGGLMWVGTQAPSSANMNRTTMNTQNQPPWVGEISERLNAVENSVNRLEASPGMAPQIDLNVPGVLVRKEGPELILVFQDGLFEHTTVLKERGKAVLTNVGKELRPYMSHVFVKIYGCTDNIPMPPGQKYKDNFALGRARAEIIYQHLQKTTELFPDRLLIGTYGKTKPPFPNDTPQNRERNRTAVIKISYAR